MRGVNWTYCDHFATHKNVQLLCCKPDTDVLSVITQFKKIKKQKDQATDWGKIIWGTYTWKRIHIQIKTLLQNNNK